ncbi:undecaprenyl phosphate translocase family protein [Algisphaera agarilytica]|uniref:Putative membrane protein n=1 Tax=Algisphaera agarilytica TaxID=1385975 RepID=A0A7X0H937_9BACT|nr:DUF368 domain-containing protein [Algisphaera agarilytica]MBB6431398.1 putative membrane protein [Algisphaera agarilytica]
MNTANPNAETYNSSEVTQTDSANLTVLAVRGGVGGVLMGLANLVPGISGGTMLLAAGVYPRFIAAIGEVTTLKFRKASVVVLGSVVLAALAAIVLLAGPVKELVVNQRWVMYSLFIGLTLGGVPVVWRLITANGRKADASVWIAAVVGFIAMAALAVYQSAGGGSDVERTGFVFMLLAGVAGASAMILPGVSGGYLLLVLGVYVPILAGVDAFKDGLKTQDMEVLTSVGLAVVLPVGLGVLLGVVGVSNLLKWLLERFEKATLGVLLGLLLGAVVGLWPFQASVEPKEGDTIKAQVVTHAVPTVWEDDEPQPTEATWIFAESGEAVDAEDLPTAFFKPNATQIGGAAGLILLGLAVTLLVDRLGREKPEKPVGQSEG